tara:strand:- start:2840 stop:3664 length:825 start_codon:yes stop_codon:yes gene_type:complete
MLWRALTKALNIQRYPKTKHFESETLFWTKAASLLEKPQLKMLKSSVPYTKERSRKELEAFLSINLDKSFSQYSDRDLVFKGWFELITEFGPTFIEKSPHHLLQVSAMDLMLEFKSIYIAEVDVKFIGLIRNPYTTLCSQIRRWQPKVEQIMEQWKLTYMNLLGLQQKVDPADIYLLRYEQLLDNIPQQLENIFKFINCTQCVSNAKSEKVRTPKSDQSLSWFGFELDDSTKYVAKSFGYSDDELEHQSSAIWPLYKFYLYHIRGTLVYIKRQF